MRFASWMYLLHSAAFMAFWLTNASFYNETNTWLADKLGTDLDYILLCLGLSGGFTLWSVARLLPARLIKRKHQPSSRWTWPYWIAGLLYLAFFYGSFILLFQESPIQKQRLLYLLSYHRLFIDVVLLLGASFGTRLWIRSKVVYPVQAAPALGTIFLAWGLALFFPPASILHSELPPKPNLIAHRGASMLAPENTLAAARQAVKLAAYGQETDVRISLDGQLFLMHDASLARTTNARQVFPGHSLRAESFTWEELSQLNAGAWFPEKGPYTSIRKGLLTEDEAEQYRQEPIPAFRDWLGVMSESGQVVIFDLLPPPDGHPYQDRIFEVAFDLIRSFEMDDQVWFLAGEEQAAFLKTNAALMKRVAGVDSRAPVPAASLLSQGYQILNAEYNLSPEMINEYRAAGLWVNLWTVDEPWLYSRSWLMGVDSITTNNLQALTSLARPVLALAYPVYLGLWLLVGLVCLGAAGSGLMIKKPQTGRIALYSLCSSE